MENTYDLHAEREVIATCFTDTQSATEYLLAFDPEHFHDQNYRKIFIEIKKASESSMELPNVFQIASSLDKSGIDADLLLNIKNSFYNADPKDIISRLDRCYRFRKALDMAQRFMQASKHVQPESFQDSILTFGQNITNLWQEKIDDNLTYRIGEKTFDIYQYALEAQEKFHKGIVVNDLIPTGYKDLDRFIIGFKRSRLTIVGARTRVGKTTFMINLIRNIPHKKIYVFTAEMTWREQILKLACLEAQIEYNRLESGNLSSTDIHKIHAAKKKIDQLYEMVNLNEKVSPKIGEMKMLLKRYKMIYGLDMVFIDHLGLLQADKKHESRQYELEYISKSLKEMAKELDVAVVCLAQLNREFEKKENPRAPRLSDLRGSGSIEQDADVILLLNRPELENKDLSVKDIMEVHISKNRFGETGEIRLKMNKLNCELVPYTNENDYASIESLRKPYGFYTQE